MSKDHSADAASSPEQFAYETLDGGTGVFSPNECPPEHRFRASEPKSFRVEFICRTPRGTWITWAEHDDWPITLHDCRFPYHEIRPDQAAVWFSRNRLGLPPILAEGLEHRQRNDTASLAKQAPKVPPQGDEPPAGSAGGITDASAEMTPEAPAELPDLVRSNQAAGTATPTKKPVVLSAKNRAMAVALRFAKEGKPLRIRDIADEADCSESYLYRCKALMDFIETAESRGKPPRGNKDRDTGTLEAWRDDD
jgi:hypothetical protein